MANREVFHFTAEHKDLFRALRIRYRDMDKFLAELNECVELGSTSLHSRSYLSRKKVVDARLHFFELLKIPIASRHIHVDVTSKLHYITQNTSASAEAIVTLYQLVPGVNFTKIINAQPSWLDFGHDNIFEKINNLKKLVPDADLAKVINKHPAFLTYAPESVREKIENLQHLLPGLDLARVINAFPVLLGLAPEGVKEKIANFVALTPEVNWVDIINLHPAVLGSAPESIWLKMKLIETVAPHLVHCLLPLSDPMNQDEKKYDRDAIKKLFMLPIESIILSIAEGGRTDKPKNIENYVIRQLGCTNRNARRQRIAHMQDRYQQEPDSLNRLGEKLGMLAPVALMMSGNNGSHCRVHKEGSWKEYAPAMTL